MNTELTITRFDIFDRADAETGDTNEVVRFFHKRKLIGEFATEDCTRYPEGFDADDFGCWLNGTKAEPRKGDPRLITEAMDYLSAEVDEDGEIEEDGDIGSVVPEQYRVLYGATQRCGDDVAEILTAYVTTGRTSKKDPELGLDRAKLFAVAELNGIADKLAEWEDRGLNGGLLRMNTSNVLRGMVRRGERVVIGEHVWEADPSKMEARLAARKANRKAAKALRKAAAA
jgi:hypothetical protein